MPQGSDQKTPCGICGLPTNVRRKTGRRAASATPRPVGRGVLYGSGLVGGKLKNEIARRAAVQAEAVYETIIACPDARSRSVATADDAFDPTNPQLPHWHRVLERFAELIAKEKKASTTRARKASLPPDADSDVG